jgi:DNA mismatch endonuclease, patch repair protein
MTDVLTPDQRRLNMRRIRAQDTKPEVLIRRGLHARGLRFRLHDSKLPGRPDLVLTKHMAVVFVHGCFWHAHGCPLSKIPETRREFWEAKLQANATRDSAAISALRAGGWRVLVVWECALRGPDRLQLEKTLDLAEAFIRKGGKEFKELTGAPWSRKLLHVASAP